MKYDTTFTNRLRAVKTDFINKNNRAEKDLQSFNNYRRNHPVGTRNNRGEPRWQGSAAETQLKEDIKTGYHAGKKPMEMWEHPSRTCYKKFPLKVFRDHIYQEIRLVKWLAYYKTKLRDKGYVFSDDEEEGPQLGEADNDEGAIEVVDDEGRLLEAPLVEEDNENE